MSQSSKKTNKPVDIRQEIFRLKYFLLYSLIAIVGLGLLLFVSLKLTKDSLEASILNNIASSLMVSGILSGAFELSLRKEFLDMNERSTEAVIKELKGTTSYIDASILSEINKNSASILSEIKFPTKGVNIGLIDAIPTAIGYDYSSFLRDQKELIIVLADGRTWTSINIHHLKERFKDENKKTTMILLHPDSSEIKAWATKTEYTEQDFKGKIGTTVRTLLSAKQEVEREKQNLGSVNLEIRGHRLLNPYSVYLGDNEAIITLYFHAGARRELPLFKFHNIKDEHSFFQNLRESILKLKEESEDMEKFKHF